MVVIGLWRKGSSGSLNDNMIILTWISPIKQEIQTGLYGKITSKINSLDQKGEK